ncbi:MAG: hypothetical protein QW520_04260 [Methanomassiliicoccales archaeon]
MSDNAMRRSNAIGYPMLLLGVLMILGSWSVVLTGSASDTIIFIAMMAVQVMGILLMLYGWKVITDPERAKVPMPPRYNEPYVVCEKCEKPVPAGARKCPACGNTIEWD